MVLALTNKNESLIYVNFDNVLAFFWSEEQNMTVILYNTPYAGNPTRCLTEFVFEPADVIYQQLSRG